MVINQEQLAAWQSGEPFFKRICTLSPEGIDVAIDRLPATVSATLEYMDKRVVPRIEFSTVNPKDVIRFVVRKPKSKNMIRLGLVSEHQDSEPYPSWLEELQVSNNKLSCTLTNVSVFDLSILLAESLGCEFDITTNGEALFRNKTRHARTKYPAYIVKRKCQSD